MEQGFRWKELSQNKQFKEMNSNQSPKVLEKVSVQSVISVTQSCLTLCDPMGYSTSGFPVHHQLLELTQTHVH